MEEIYTVTWQQTEIGNISGLRNDMWYYEGEFSANDSEVASQFTKLVSGFDAKRIMQDPYQGTTIILNHTSDPLKNIYFLVLSLDDRQLFIRILRDESYQMLTSAVKGPEKPTRHFLRRWIHKLLRGQ